MSHATESTPQVWTAAQLAERFGEIPLNRIRHDPLPGLATEQHVIEIHAHEKRLYELIEGVLVEKTVGTYECSLAALIVQILGSFVRGKNLGVVLAADGMMRLFLGTVRIPDVSYISWERWPHEQVMQEAIADLAPELAVEVISPGNTEKEMADKLRDYFNAGVRLVWYIYPSSREVKVYTSPDNLTLLNEQQALDGGDVLTGFQLELRELFAEPRREDSNYSK